MNIENSNRTDRIQYSCNEIKKIIGSNIEITNDNGNVLNFTFFPELALREWEKVSELSDAIADYYIYDIADYLRNSNLSIILNELIENAVKYSKEGNSPIDVETHKDNGKLYIEITNEVSKQGWNLFVDIFPDVFTKDISSVYIKKLIDLRENPLAPGIGLILLKKDFFTNMNFRFFESDDNKLWVTVNAEVKIS